MIEPMKEPVEITTSLTVSDFYRLKYLWEKKALLVMTGLQREGGDVCKVTLREIVLVEKEKP
jgi:hypothetical protein